MTKIGLALGGGGAKGICHISIIEYIEERGIKIDYIAGCSIGSVIGAIYSMGKLSQLKEDLLKLNKRSIFKNLDFVLPKSGFINGQKAIDYIQRYIPKETRFQDLKIPLAVVATDYITGSQVIFRKGNVLDALRASFSIPGVFVPAVCNKKIYLDGGVVNPLPIDVLYDMGAEKTIAVNLYPEIKTAKLNEQGVFGDQGNGFFSKTSKFFNVKKKTKIPNLIEVINQTFHLSQISSTRWIISKTKPTILIEPKLSNIALLDFSKTSCALEEGKKACLKIKNKFNQL